uniref:Spaetzle domain-containing protein n=1 Tax=Strigamia maritima TaxID=126957 RepID=T1JFT0_STRMM
IFFASTFLLLLLLVDCQRSAQPEQVLAWIEAPADDDPPKLNKPPYYVYTEETCRGLADNGLEYNLCGDVNGATIPRNPMGQNPLGQRYPFEFIRNKTLDYLRSFVPLLEQDPRLPKVSKLNNRHERELVIETSSEPDYDYANDTSEGRAIPCTDSSNLLCRMWGMLSNMKPNLNRNGVEREREKETNVAGMSTACPSMAHYATPLFARNYRGVWRYVIQIPFEGYLVQSVEVTKCTNQKCSFMAGECLSSSRWTSLLAAEIFYPTSSIPHAAPIIPITTPPPHADVPVPPVYDFQNFQQYLIMRAGGAGGANGAPTIDKMDRLVEPANLPRCDGIDQQGCFQLRMFYDWFLVPGACKCWRSPARQTLFL